MPDDPQAQATTSTVANQLPDQQSQPANAPQTLFAKAMQSLVQPQATTSTVDNTIPSPAQVSQSPITGGPQVNTGNGQPAPLASTLTQVQRPPDALQSHPAVKRAELLHRVAETIAGGPKIQTTYNDDGSVTHTPVPLSTKQILLGSLANILGGVGDVSQNLSARMKGQTPPNQNPQLATQQAQQKQDEISEADYNRQQNAKVRQAKVLNANLEAMRSAYALGKEDDATKDAAIANHADDLTNWQKAGAVEASHVPSNEIMQRGYDPGKFVSVIDGKIPVYKADGTRATDSNGVPLSQFTYSIVDGTTQTQLTQDKYDQLTKYGLMRAQKPLSDQGNEFKLPEGATISSAQLALMNHKLDLISQTQNELDEVHNAVGAPKVDIAAEIKKNPQLLTAIEQFHNDGASSSPVSQLQNMAASNNPKVKGAVGPMTALFGQDNLTKFAAANQNAPDNLSLAGAKQILADPRTDPNSPAAKTAQGIVDASGSEEEKAYNEAKQKNPKLDRVTFHQTWEKKPVDDTDIAGIQQTARNIVSGNNAVLSDVVSRQGKDRRAVESAIQAEAVRQGKDPAKFSPTALRAKDAMYKDYTEGKTSNNIASFDAFLGHANDAMDANDNWRRSNSPLINKPLSWLAQKATNDPNYIAFDTALEPVRKEFMSFLNANRAEHSEDLKTMETVLNSNNSPAQIETALKQLGKSADIRLAAIGRKYQNLNDTPFPNLISDDGKQALSRMGIQSKALAQAPSPQTVQPPATQNNPPATQNNRGGFDWNTLPKVQQ